MVGLAYLLILLIPISSLAILKLSGSNQVTLDRKIDWRSLLFGFQGVALAFWSFDIITTFYAIDFTGLAIELNPYGLAYGHLGRLRFLRSNLNVCVYVAVQTQSQHCPLRCGAVNVHNVGDGFHESGGGGAEFSSFCRHRRT